MIKRYYIAVLLLLCVVTGCIKEDTADCPPPHNTVLKFTYSHAGTQANFTDYIGKVDVLIFDTSNELVLHQMCDLDFLKARAELLLTLPEGIYRVVCIGNLYGKSILRDRNSTLTFTSGEIITNDPSSGDPLYYAPAQSITKAGQLIASEFTRADDIYTLVVPSRGSVEREFDFMRIHRSVKVYVSGLSAGQQSPPPLIKINDLPIEYTMTLFGTPGKRDYISQTTPVTTDGKAMLQSSFYSPYYDITDEYYITLTSGVTGENLCSPINLKAYLDSNPAADTDDIEMLIEFKDGSVTVTLPGWGAIPVDPVGNK